MFADNQKISNRQLKRQMVISFAGVLVLLLSGGVAGGGLNAVFGIILGYLGLLAFFFFLSQNVTAMRKLVTGGKVLKWIVYLVYGSFLVLTGGYLLEQICKISHIYLLSEIDPNLLKILILVTAALGMGSDVQKRGRMGEASFSLIFWGFVLLLILAALHMRIPDVQAMPKVNGKSMLSYGYLYFSMGTIISLLPFAYVKTERRKKQTWEMGKSWLLLTILIISTVLILLGTYGYPGVKTMELPVLNLMAGTSLPGGFLDRFDIIWMALLLFALLFSLGSLLFYCVRLVRTKEDSDKEKESRISRNILWGAAALMWAASMVNIEGIKLNTVYLKLLQFGYAPLFVIITLLAGCGLRRRRK